MELYIHIPFCKKKCDYCDFYSIMPCEKYNLDKFIPSLIKEISLAGNKYKDRKISTIFISRCSSNSFILSFWLVILFVGYE